MFLQILTSDVHFGPIPTTDDPYCGTHAIKLCYMQCIECKQSPLVCSSTDKTQLIILKVLLNDLGWK